MLKNLNRSFLGSNGSLLDFCCKSLSLKFLCESTILAFHRDFLQIHHSKPHRGFPPGTPFCCSRSAAGTGRTSSTPTSGPSCWPSATEAPGPSAIPLVCSDRGRASFLEIDRRNMLEAFSKLCHQNDSEGSAFFVLEK